MIEPASVRARIFEVLLILVGRNDVTRLFKS